MNAHIFTARGIPFSLADMETRARAVLSDIARDTHTSGLIVAVYLLARRDFWEAHTYTDAVTPAVFARTGREWEFVRRFGVPPGLPERFPLIRMAFGLKDPFPRTIHDVYGWELQCQRFEDLLAYTFAHELHHYRRYYLGLHAGEGEQTACRWALAHAAQAGYRVQGTRERPPTRPKAKQPDGTPGINDTGLLRRIKLAASHLNSTELEELQRWTRERLATFAGRLNPSPMERHFARLRSLPPGAELIITRDDDPRSRYVGLRAVKIRTLRRNSFRIAVRTPDGKEWHWPMQWLKLPDKLNPEKEGDAGRQRAGRKTGPAAKVS